MNDNIKFNKENFELFKQLLKEEKFTEMTQKIPMEEVIMYFGLIIDENNKEFKDKTLEKTKNN